MSKQEGQISQVAKNRRLLWLLCESSTLYIFCW